MPTTFPSRSLARAFGVVVFLAAFGGALPAHPQGTLSALQTDVDQLSRRARPSIVSVVAELPSRPATPNAGTGHARLQVGSGVAIEESAVVTTASVVQGARRVFVRTSNDIEVEAQVVGSDVIFNLAYLRVPDLRLPPMALAAERPAPQAGDWTIALGTSYRREPTQSVGTVVDRQSSPGLTLLQLSNTVYPGNSGGAVLNARGELIGMVLGELSRVGGSDEERRAGANSVMLPLEHLRPALEDLRRGGHVRHGWIGVASQAVFVESRASQDVRVPIGALVESVAPGGPAARAGVRAGDLLVAFGGERVDSPNQLGLWVTASRPGTSVELVWVRNDLRQSARIVLGESPSAQPDRAIADAMPGASRGPSARIGEIEREIDRLRGELARLRGQPSAPAR